MNANHVISANYYNRDNTAQRWLVRTGHEPLNQARPVAAISAEKVRFEFASDGEVDFGCKVVATAQNVTEVADSGDVFLAANLKLERLRFDGHQFVDDRDRVVTEVERLSLLSDGSMYAVILSPSKALARAIYDVRETQLEIDRHRVQGARLHGQLSERMQVLADAHKATLVS